MIPVRLQLSRRKGFSLQTLSLATNGLPAVNCARPGKWGNPYLVGAMPMNGDNGQTLDESLWAYENLFLPGRDLSPLRGKNLACYCPVGARCHCDVLLREANR